MILRSILVICSILSAFALDLSAHDCQNAQLRRALDMTHVNIAEAKRLLSEYVNANPASLDRFEAVMGLADCYYGEDYAKALDLYLQIDPQYIDPAVKETCIYRTAYCYMMTGKLAKADAQFDRLSGSVEYGKSAAFYQGYIAYRQGVYARAVDLFEKSKSNAAPGNMADYYLAQIAYMQGDYAKAASLARSLLSTQSVESQYLDEAYRIAGESYYRIGSNAAAVKYLRDYLDRCKFPQPSALYIIGLDEYEKGNYEAAIKDFTPATQQGDAMSQSAYLYIGQAQMKTGDVDGAILSFDSALSMDFDPIVQETAYYNYAVASLQGGKVPFGNSINTFENFLRRYPNSQYAPDAQKYIVTAYLNSRDYAAALASINNMKNPSTDTYRAKQQVLYMLGSQALASGNALLAIDYLQQAQKLGKYDGEINRETSLLLGEAYYQDKKYDESARQLLSYINSKAGTGQNLAVAYYDLGYTRFAQKKYSDAATDFKRMLDRKSDIPADIQADACARLGDCYYYLHQFDNAAAAYDKSYTLSPSRGDYAMMQKALMEGYQRRHHQKIKLLQQLQSDYPSSGLIPDALLEMTESYIQLGDNDGAIAVYKQLVGRYPNTAQGRQGYLQMALTMMNAGRRQDAIDAYKDVIVNYPSSDEAMQAADQLKRIYAADGDLSTFMTFINNVPNAPRMEASEADQLTFEAAEKSYITQNSTQLLEKYVEEYVTGANRAKALSYLVEGYYGQDKADPAYKYASMLVNDYPDNSLAEDALMVKAEIEYAQGKGILALKTWKTLEQKASSTYLLNKARMGVMRGSADASDHAETMRAATDALSSAALDTDSKAEALYLRGQAEMAMGKADMAKKDWEEAAQNAQCYYGMAASFALADSYFKANNLEKAEKQAKKVTDADTPHSYWVARGFILLSDIYAKQGNDFKAQQYLKSLKENYPGNEQDIFQMIQQRSK